MLDVNDYRIKSYGAGRWATQNFYGRRRVERCKLRVQRCNNLRVSFRIVSSIDVPYRSFLMANWSRSLSTSRITKSTGPEYVVIDDGGTRNCGDIVGISS